MTTAAESRILGHFRLLEEIGSGGMGVVYRAHDEHLDRDVAVKVLPAQATTVRAFDSKARRALRREALTLSRLNHPNIAQVYDFDKEGDTDFIVMELVPGESLAQRLNRGPLSPDEVLSIAKQMLEGLAAAHAQGIIHRDLKPANLQITTEGRLKILDFGLARFLPRKGLDVETATTVTHAEGLSGTMAYISPEQLHGEACDERSDIWSAGAVLYEMQTGRLPFPGKTAAAIADAILHDEVKPFDSDSAPALLQAVIKHCLAKDPQARYQTAQEFLTDVRRVASNPVEAPELGANVPVPARRAARRSMFFVGLVLLAGLLIGGRAWRNSQTAATPEITSVAVLPLANLSTDPAQEYFSDGMTDEIINELSRASSLKVISRTSVMHYKNTDKPISVIARELNVEGVIEGSVLREGNKVRINAQLIRAATEKPVWADTFERDERNVLALQGEIAHAIMRELRVRLGGEENGVEPRSVNSEAYDAWLKARFYTYRVTAADNAKAEQFAREAVGKQPDLGEAYHILAEILWYQAMTLGNPTVAESRALLQESQAAAEKANSLGANAHSTYALLLFTHGEDLMKVESEYRRAIELQPNMSAVHGHFGVYLSVVGRCTEARSELLRAVELDPTGEFALSIAGEFLMYCKDLEASEQYLLAAMNLDPSYQRARTQAERLYLTEHRIPQLLKVIESSDRSEEEKAQIRRKIATGGESGYRRWMLKRVLSDRGESQRAFNVASAYGIAGERSHTLRFLWRAYEQGDPRIRWVRAFPQYWFLHGDPEFNRLLRKLGLPETQK